MNAQSDTSAAHLDTPKLHNIISMDVEKSAERKGSMQTRMREDLYAIVGKVLKDNHLIVEPPSYEDRGDEVRLILAVEQISPARILTAFVPRLSDGLRDHREYVSPAARIRLRMCFNVGLLDMHRGKWNGGALIHVARLIEAQPLRQRLIDDPEADLAVIISDTMYQLTARHGYGGFSAHCYREVRVKVKEYDDRAWLLDF